MSFLVSHIKEIMSGLHQFILKPCLQHREGGKVSVVQLTKAIYVTRKLTFFTVRLLVSFEYVFVH